jgi:hypothetical protein
MALPELLLRLLVTPRNYDSAHAIRPAAAPGPRVASRIVVASRSKAESVSDIPFTKYELGHLSRGSTVVVTLTSGANVRLMDSSNLNAYRAGRQHRFWGGLVDRSPFRIVVPSDGTWYVTVDVVGLKNGTRSSVAVEPPRMPLPRAREAAPNSLEGIRHELPPELATDLDETWDVFVSHASEDKASVARPLSDALRALNITVWLDETELRIGDSLRRKIDQGLARSRFGVVIFSRSFFSKGWPQYELDGIVTRSVSGEQTILPIWHEITKDEVMAQTPSLVDKIARSTAQFTIAEIAAEIADVVRPDGHQLDAG